MTALQEYQRLEATGLWRASPDDQRREVLVSVGDATLTISTFQNKALTHWSLAAINRQNPGTLPAIYSPDGDEDETLELPASEVMMIEAIERLRRAVERARPHPGRLRSVSILFSLATIVFLLVFWLPGATQRHALSVVPGIKRQEIGAAVLAKVERLSGRACTGNDTAQVLGRLARRLDVRRLVILPSGVRDSSHLPGGIVLLNKSVIEDHEDPAVAAGYILAERLRARQTDPLSALLDNGGVMASFRLLTTGGLPGKNLENFAEDLLVAEHAPLDDDALLQEFTVASVSSTPYAYAQDITGETTLGLIEADPMAGQTPQPVLPDRDWVLLQGVCGG